MRREAILDFLAGIVNDNGCCNDFFVLFGVAADAMPSNFPADITSTSTGLSHPPPVVNILNLSTAKLHMPRFHQREQLTSPDTSLTLRKLIPLPLKVTVKFNIHKALFIFVSKVCSRK